MLKALLRKEFAQIKKMYTSGKKGQRRSSKGQLILLIVLYFIVMLSMGALDSLFALYLIPEGLGWLYYTYILAFGFLFGVIGSVFTTSEMLYKAKDNELLLSMPIPPATILFVRMVGVYFMGMLYGSIVALPGVVLYFIFAGITVLNFICGILGLILLGFLILVFSCFFGWIVALISARLKNKHIMTVIISAVFIGLFLYLRFRMNEFFQMLAENAEEIAETLENIGFALYAPGLGMTGNIPAMLYFLAVVGVLFGITYRIISRSFSRIINIKPKEKKAAFSEGQIRTADADKALFRKEVKRFISSPGYMLNSGLGILMIIAGAIVVIIMSGTIRTAIEGFVPAFAGGYSPLPVFIAFAICMIAGTINLAAPNISLEGRSVWILHSMPVSPMQVIKAKLKMCILIPLVPTVVCALVIQIALGSDVVTIILTAILSGVYVIFCAEFGLLLDLNKPFLDWTSEMQAVKQKMSVFYALMVGMLAPVVPAVLYLIFARFISPAVYIAVWIVIVAALAYLLYNSLRKKGPAKFALLGQ